MAHSAERMAQWGLEADYRQLQLWHVFIELIGLVGFTGIGGNYIIRDIP
jgi:hypothetical protein